jgi:hypothetical protein
MANVEPLADGMAADCSEEQFKGYLKEVEPMPRAGPENIEML